MKYTECSTEKEKGFTLIELLTSVGIIGVLVGISISAFSVYKKDAHYSRAVSDLGNAQIAAFVGLNDSVSGMNVAFTFTGTQGGAVPAALNQAMPGAMTSPDVRLGAQFNSCPEENFFPQMILIAQPCHGDKYITYIRFCNGVDVRIPKKAKDYVCP